MPQPAARPADSRWRASHPDVRAISLDDELVVFNPITWETHLLNPAGALVFEALQERPMTLHELHIELEAFRADDAQPVREEHIQTLLIELEDLGLVARVSTELDADR